MKVGADSVIARLFDADNVVVGAGFIATPSHLLTCAHVVNAALGRELLEAARPPNEATVELDFPLCAGERISARVAAWRLPNLDAAVLRLDDESPSDQRVRKFVASADPTGMEFRAFGFPEGFEDGRHERGVVTGVIANGRVEVRPKDGHDYFVERGFSGTPAFAIADQVLGMVVATGPEPEKRLAYLIPVRDLEKTWPPLAAPYRGLQPFEEDTAHWFRGRDEFVERILEKLKAEPVVAVVGASGSGKSSVVKAGVIPRLRSEGWAIAACRIGEEPCWNLSEAVAALIYTNADTGTRFDRAKSLADEWHVDPTAAGRRLDGLLREHSAPGLFVLLDQFEEIITRASEAERRAFDALLKVLTGEGAPDRLRLTLTLRSDFEDDISRLSCGRRLLNDGRVRLTKMTRQELADAVRGPAAELGVSFEAGRDWQMIDLVERDDALLPLLQYALQELWQHQEAGVISDAALTEIGGLEGVLAKKAEEVLRALDEAQQDLARRLFVHHLVQVSEGGLEHDTKLSATRRDIGDDMWSVAQAFAAEGCWLLVTRQESDRDVGDAVVEITHEALIRHWRQLAKWLDAVRDLRVWEADMLRDMAASTGRFDEVWSESETTRARMMLEHAEVRTEIREFAARMLCNSAAADLWSDLQSSTHREKAIMKLAGLDARTRDSVVARLLHDTRCADALLQDYKSISRAAFGLDPARRGQVRGWIDGTESSPSEVLTIQCRAMLGSVLHLPTPFILLLDALRHSHGIGPCDALGRALAAIALRIDAPQTFAESLLDALRWTVDYHQCDALGRALAAIAPRLESPESFAESLLDALSKTIDPGQCDALGQALAAIGPRLEAPQTFADSLLEALQNTDDPGQCGALGQALAAIGQRLEACQTFANSLLDALRRLPRDTPSSDAAELGQALAAIVPHLESPQTFADRLLDALLETIIVSQHGALGQALAAIAARIESPQSFADRLLDAMRQPIVYSHYDALGQALAAVAPRLESPQSFADRLLDAVCYPDFPSQYSAVGQVYASIAPRLEVPQSFAESLLGALSKTESLYPMYPYHPYRASHTLGQALAAIGPCLESPGSFAESLLDALSKTIDPGQCDALGQALAAIGPRLEATQSFADSLLDALREPGDRDRYLALGQALAATGPRLESPDSFAGSLLDALRETLDPGQYLALGQALAAIVPGLDTPQSVADGLLEALHETDDNNQCRALGHALAALVNEHVQAGGNRPSWFVEVFGALRHPRLAGSELETAVEIAHGVSEDGSLWDAVKRFKELYPDAKLDTAWPQPLLPLTAAEPTRCAGSTCSGE